MEKTFIYTSRRIKKKKKKIQNITSNYLIKLHPLAFPPFPPLLSDSLCINQTACTAFIPSSYLTNDHGILSGEIVLRNFKIKRCRTLPCTTGDIIMGTMARTEPTTIVTSFTNRDTTEVSADALTSQLVNRIGHKGRG